jgi:hypothetical protein
MKGIQMLLEMNKNEPDNTSVMNLLGQLVSKPVNMTKPYNDWKNHIKQTLTTLKHHAC